MKNFTKIKSIARTFPRVAGAPEWQAEFSHEGKGLNPGIVIGRAYVYDPVLKVIPRYHIAALNVQTECRRFMNAVAKTAQQLEAVKQQANLASDDPVLQVFDVYQYILTDSRLVRGVLTRIEKDLINAEAALQIEIGALTESFVKIKNSYLASRLEDFKGLAMRIGQNMAPSFPAEADMPDNAIIVAERLTAADTTSFDLANVAGLIIEKGSQQSHAALLSRSLALPAVISVADLVQNVHTGDVLIIDGTYGKVIVNPTQETLTRYRKYRADFLRWKHRLKHLAHLPCVTPDGVSVSLKCNIDLIGEVEALLQAGADGVGLLRSEYLFINRDAPDEEEQFQILRDISERLGNRPVTFRTLDADGEKLSPVLPVQAINPALSLRGIRYTLKHSDVLETQFAAAIRANVYGKINILLPMISSVEELRLSRDILRQTADRLRDEGKEVPDELPSLGVMIEVPSAALEASVLAENSDFLSIGTNDLIQYTLAVDRLDENVSAIFSPLHPAILKLLKMTADAAKKACIPLCVCGDMAANPLYAPILLGLGVRELSMPATNLPLVKDRILRCRMDEMEYFVDNLLQLTDAAAISGAVEDFANRYK